MSALLLTLALLAADQPAVAETLSTAPAEAQAPAAAPLQDTRPAGAPDEDYPFVAWCYGNLRAYLDLHDRVMPEVTRIESTYRPPNRKLSDDMKVYADMQKDGNRQLAVYLQAMTAAEKASLRPINAIGAQYVARGRAVWRVGSDVSPARLAQEWMSWTLPARCEITAKNLDARSSLLGASFRVNVEPEPEAPAPAPAAEPGEAPATPSVTDMTSAPAS